MTNKEELSKIEHYVSDLLNQNGYVTLKEVMALLGIDPITPEQDFEWSSSVWFDKHGKATFGNIWEVMK